MGLIDNSVLQNGGKGIKFILYMQILIGKIRHFDYLSHISVNLSHTQKYKVCSINLCKVFHDVFCVFFVNIRVFLIS